MLRPIEHDPGFFVLSIPLILFGLWYVKRYIDFQKLPTHDGPSDAEERLAVDPPAPTDWEGETAIRMMETEKGLKRLWIRRIKQPGVFWFRSKRMQKRVAQERTEQDV